MTEAARDRLAQIRLKAAAIIPAYHEEKHIGNVVRRTRQQLDHVLVVDDGSNDQTAQRIPDTQCGFRMLDRQLIPDLLGGANRFDYETEMLIIASRKGYRIESVPITTVYSDEVSNIQPLRDAIRFFKLMRRYKSFREN